MKYCLAIFPVLILASIFGLGCKVRVGDQAIISKKFLYDDNSCQLGLKLRTGNKLFSKFMGAQECNLYQEGEVVWLYLDGTVEKIIE